MPENGAEDRTEGMRSLARVVVAGGAGDHDGLRVDHLAHDAAGGVGGDDQDRVETELLGGDALQAAEKRVRCRIRARQEDAEPAEIRGEERIKKAGVGEREAEDRVRTRIAGEEAETQNLADDEDRRLHPLRGLPEDALPL